MEAGRHRSARGVVHIGFYSWRKARCRGAEPCPRDRFRSGSNRKMRILFTMNALQWRVFEFDVQDGFPLARPTRAALYCLYIAWGQQAFNWWEKVFQKTSQSICSI
jgi:hypothetical protein